ncbi:MAG TPA: DUF1700 domain-containing protein [Epulopiscium sp.]|nr:DUF1700 domain-containing protein [Candidatus Epulonipiscium sp.]
MKKHEFLRELEISLKGKVSETDMNEILSDYNDIFEDCLLENRDEDEISEGIGSPAAIAKAIIDESVNSTTMNGTIPIAPDTSNLASMSKRFLAYLIDTVVIFIVLIGLSMTIYTPGIGFSHTTITESSTSYPGGINYTQRVYLDKNNSPTKIKLYKNNKKIFSGKKPAFDKFMQNNLDIKINSMQTVQKSPSSSYSLDEPGSIFSIMLFIGFLPYLFIFMALGFANITTAFQLWLFKGYTLGKRITKIKVVRLDDHKITFWDAFLRDILLKFAASIVTSGILNMVSFIMGCATPDHKTVHDLVAKTKVINIER